MFKKLAVAGASAALLLATSVPAFADYSMVHNWADLSNTLNTLANTGNNQIKADDSVNGGNIGTGYAQSVATLNNTINSNTLYSFGAGGFDFGGLVHNATEVNNLVNTTANTGWNSIVANEENVNGGNVNSGYAQAGSVVNNVINTNVLHNFGFGGGDN